MRALDEATELARHLQIDLGGEYLRLIAVVRYVLTPPWLPKGDAIFVNTGPGVDAIIPV